MSSRPSLLVRLYYAVTRPPRVAYSVGRILSGFGYWRSARCHEPVDATGREIPWFTYPAIEYLGQLDFSMKTVFEFGAGNSTIYWCRRARQVVSVENNRSWYEHIRPRLAANGELHLIEASARYPRILAERPEPFDVIVIDGIERRACCIEAAKKLRPGGLIILDNSDWHHHCAALLRAAGLLEVDMAGFGPINGYTWTTSFFFGRDFACPSRHDRQPAHSIGSLPEMEPET